MGPSAARNALVPGGALLLGVGLTAVVVLQDRRAVGPDAQPALDSAAAIIGLLLAYVLLGRFWESRRVRDLFLCAFLLLLGLSNALFAALPRALGNPTHPAASAAAGALAGSAFVAATWLPPWPWRRSRLRALVLLLVLAGVALSVAAAVDVPVTAAQWLASTLFLVGALGAGRAGRHDGLMTWLSAAGLLGVGSRIDFALSQRGLRRAIAALTRPLDEPFEVSLAQCAEEVCGRFDRQLVLDVQPGVQASSDIREALLRVVREAVSNAARHSGADEVRVRLRQSDRLELRVEDDGRGFDPDDAAHLSGRFGLVSMRERVVALGGTFTLVSRLPGGTAIEVTLP
ncbi:MAG: hypothetical protein LC779_11590 [Actinobacteria bacterium]|nr:hypothetical protein [Actinomycetota bacterium]